MCDQRVYHTDSDEVFIGRKLITISVQIKSYHWLFRHCILFSVGVYYICKKYHNGVQRMTIVSKLS